MDIAFAVKPWALGGALVTAAVVGTIYARLLNGRLEWLARDATEHSTMIGVLGTLLVCLIILPPAVVFLVFLFFVATGIPQMLRSAYNRSVRPKAAVQAQKEALLKQTEIASSGYNGRERAR